MGRQLDVGDKVWYYPPLIEKGVRGAEVICVSSVSYPYANIRPSIDVVVIRDLTTNSIFAIDTDYIAP